jgi:PAS domain S-box-containing protein
MKPGSGNFPRPNLTPELQAALIAAREEALDQLLRVVRWVALAAVIVAAVAAAYNDTWWATALYALAFVSLFGLSLAKKMPLRWRGGIFAWLWYGIAVVNILSFGLAGASRVFLLTFAVMVTILFGTRAGLWALGLSLITWFIGAALFFTGLLPPPQVLDFTSIVDWLNAGTSLLLVAVALILPQRQFLETQAFAVATSKQNTELEIAKGELTQQAEELELASRKLTEVNVQLMEQSRVLERRASQLAVSAEVARVAATLHDLPTLLDTTVQLISQRFGFYHAGIFLIDETGEWAVLRAANSAGGQRMLARNHRLQVGQQGIVGFVTGMGQPRIALNVGEDTVHFRNPDLPATQSEMAVPLRGRAGIIGALDVQSVEVNAFNNDDISTLQTLADQLAIAIDNARLLQATQRSLEELRALQRESRAASPVMAAIRSQAYRYDGVDTRPVTDTGPLAQPAGAPALQVPIRVGDETLGVIELQRAGAEWTEDDRQLTEAIAERMGYALESAHLFDETRRRLTELETLNRISEALTAQTDLPTLLKLVGDKILETFNVSSGYIALYDRREQQIVFLYDVENDAYNPVSKYPLGQGLSSIVIQTGQPLLLNSTREAEALDPIRDGDPARSYLSVPIIVNDVVTGLVNVQSTVQEGLFTDNDVRLLSIIAASLGAAIEKARLFDETQRRLTELQTVNNIGGILASQLDLSTMLWRVGDKVMETFGVKSGYIALYDRENNLIDIPYAMKEGVRDAVSPFPLERGPSAYVIETRQPLLINHDTVHEMEVLGARQRGEPALSYLGVPIIVGENVLGLISVQSTERENLFNEDDVRLLSTIASNIGVAIENVSLFEQTQTALAETEALYQASTTLSAAQNYSDLLNALRQHTLLRDAQSILLNRFETPWAKARMPQWSEALARWSQAAGFDQTPVRHPTGPALQGLLHPDRPTLVEDISKDPRLDESTRAVYLIRHRAQSMLFVPLVIGGEWEGYLNATYENITSFPEQEVRRLMSLAQQAALLIENFRNTALIERRAEQLAALNRVAVSVANSSLDPQVMLTEVCREFVSIFGARTSGVALLNSEGTSLTVIAEYSSDPGATSSAGVVIPVTGNPSSERVVETRRSLVIPEAQTDPLTEPIHELMHQRQVQCLAIVPLVARGKVSGTLGLDSAEPGRVFTDSEVALAETMAGQISNAIENSQLFAQAQRRAQQLLTAAEVSQAATSLLNTDELIARSVELIRERFDLYYAALFLADADNRWAVLVHATGEAGQRLMEIGHKLEIGGNSMIGWAVANRKARIALDVGEEKVRFVNPLLPGTRSEMALPLIVGDRAIGAISVQSTQPNAFSEEDITVLQTMADQIAIAIRNAQLIGDQRLTLQALDYERFLLQTLLDNVPDKIYFKDRHSRFLRVSKAVATQFGLEPEKVVGKSDFDFFSSDHARQAYEDERAMMRTGEPVLGRLELETWPDRPDTWALTSKLVLRDNDGQVIGTFGISRDVTALKHLEEESRRLAQQLLTAAEISRTATNLLDERAIVRQTVELLRERFNLYFVAIFLVDETGQWAELRHATGEAGRLLLRLGHQLEVGGKSMIGWAIANRKARISADVEGETVRFANPLTPETRSEMALPLIVGDLTLGAISVQSTQRNAFGEADVASLQTIADQIAASLQNARLYQRVSRQELNATALAHITQSVSSQLEEAELLQTLARELCHFYKADGVIVYRWDLGAQALTPLAAEIANPEAHDWPAPERSFPIRVRPDLHEVLTLRATKVRAITPVGEDELRESLVAPLFFHEVIDFLVEVVHTGGSEGLSSDDIDLIEAVMTAAASALQIARLYAQQRETAERLAEVDRLKTQFLANMSHELRTPLNSIIGFSRVILKGIDGPINEVQRQDLSSIYNSGHHLLGLINDVLDLSRIEAGKMELAFAEVNLNDVLEGVLATTRGLIKDKPIELIRDIPDHLPALHADSTRLRQILLNLLSNAAKFTHQGQIRVSARMVEAVHRQTEQTAPFMEISVSDTGPGISAEDIGRLFERFSQLDGSATRKAGGTGLGLHISRYLVEMHGGRIWAESAGTPGRGATFRFTMPVSQPEPALPLPRESGVVKLIVAIEDDQGLTTLYRRYLESHGYQLVGVHKSEEAVSRVIELQPAAILLDVIMPNKDGWQVLAELKREPATRDIPVIMCTIAMDQERARTLGAADYLTKPILESELTRALNRVISTDHAGGSNGRFKDGSANGQTAEIVN